MVATLPFILTTCVAILFIQFGISFLSGIAVFVLSFLVNVKISSEKAKLQRAYMKKQDERVNATSECLNNIKTVKMFSWTDVFFELISSRRNEELKIFYKGLQYGVLVVSSLYFFPLVL